MNVEPIGEAFEIFGSVFRTYIGMLLEHYILSHTVSDVYKFYLLAVYHIIRPQVGRRKVLNVEPICKLFKILF